MKIGDVMTPDVEAVNPDDTLKTAAQLMWCLDSAALPVGENDLLIGVITDHDRSCPREWCKSGVGFALCGGFSRCCQAAAAGSLKSGSSLNGAIVSRVM